MKRLIENWLGINSIEVEQKSKGESSYQLKYGNHHYTKMEIITLLADYFIEEAEDEGVLSDTEINNSIIELIDDEERETNPFISWIRDNSGLVEELIETVALPIESIEIQGSHYILDKFIEELKQGNDYYGIFQGHILGETRTSYVVLVSSSSFNREDFNLLQDISEEGSLSKVFKTIKDALEYIYKELKWRIEEKVRWIKNDYGPNSSSENKIELNNKLKDVLNNYKPNIDYLIKRLHENKENNVLGENMKTLKEEWLGINNVSIIKKPYETFLAYDGLHYYYSEFIDTLKEINNLDISDDSIEEWISKNPDKVMEVFNQIDPVETVEVDKYLYHLKNPLKSINMGWAYFTIFNIDNKYILIATENEVSGEDWMIRDDFKTAEDVAHGFNTFEELSSYIRQEIAISLKDIKDDLLSDYNVETINALSEEEQEEYNKKLKEFSKLYEEALNELKSLNKEVSKINENISNRASKTLNEDWMGLKNAEVDYNDIYYDHHIYSLDDAWEIIDDNYIMQMEELGVRDGIIDMSFNYTDPTSVEDFIEMEEIEEDLPEDFVVYGTWLKENGREEAENALNLLWPEDFITVDSVSYIINKCIYEAEFEEITSYTESDYLQILELADTEYDSFKYAVVVFNEPFQNFEIWDIRDWEKYSEIHIFKDLKEATKFARGLVIEWVQRQIRYLKDEYNIEELSLNDMNDREKDYYERYKEELKYFLSKDAEPSQILLDLKNLSLGKQLGENWHLQDEDLSKLLEEQLNLIERRKRKKRKGITLKKNAGNPQVGMSYFNHLMGSDYNDCCGVSDSFGGEGGVGESMEIKEDNRLQEEMSVGNIASYKDKGNKHIILTIDGKFYIRYNVNKKEQSGFLKGPYASYDEAERQLLKAAPQSIKVEEETIVKERLMNVKSCNTRTKAQLEKLLVAKGFEWVNSVDLNRAVWKFKGTMFESLDDIDTKITEINYVKNGSVKRLNEASDKVIVDYRDDNQDDAISSIANYDEEDVRNLAKDIAAQLTADGITQDVTLYYLGGQYDIKNGELTFITEGNPREYFEYVRTPNILSMSFEGPLYDKLNYGDINYLQDIFDRYDLYYEMGNAWNISAYPIVEEKWLDFDNGHKEEDIEVKEEEPSDKESEVINIREELNKLDTINYRDLVNMYDCCKLTLEEKKKIASMLSGNKPTRLIEKFLNDKLGVKW